AGVRVALWLVLGLLVVGVAALALGPRAQPGPLPAAADLPADLDRYLAEAEGGVPGITPGVEKRILWAGAPGARTPLALGYLHGWWGAAQEIAPVMQRVAGRTGANLYRPRLAGHGLVGAALAGARPEDWLADAAEAV